MEQRPHIGVGVYLVHQGKVLFMQRKAEHGAGTWAPPGGHLEHGEHWDACAVREAQEEVNITLQNPRLFAVTNDIYQSGKHYVTLHVEAQATTAAFTNREADKHAQVGWFAWDELPEPLFTAVANLRSTGAKPGYLA